jgi:hypothetical protein
MRTFLLNTINQIPATNRQLDYRSTLKTNEWLVYTDSEGEIEKFLFADNDVLLASVNGKTTSSKWQFMKVNSSLIIDDGINKYMFKIIVCSKDIVFLNVDSTQTYSFLINTKSKALKDVSLKDIKQFLMNEFNIDIFDDEERTAFFEKRKENEKKIREAADKKAEKVLECFSIIVLAVLIILGIVKLKEKKREDEEYNRTHPNMSITRIENRHAIDLGLSVKWATCDIGANHPTEAGNKYGWGDTTGIIYEDYIINDFGFKEYVPYNRKENEYAYPTRIGKKAPTSIVDTQYDVARLCWGDKWRMPTCEEAQELIDSCVFIIRKDYIVAIGPSGDSILFSFPSNWYATGEMNIIKPQQSMFNFYENDLIYSYIIGREMRNGSPVIINGKPIVNVKIHDAYRFNRLSVRAVCEE